MTGFFMKKLMVILVSVLCATSAVGQSKLSDIKALKTYCEPDVERLCRGVEYGDGAVKKCLENHKMEISVGCAKALKALKDG